MIKNWRASLEGIVFLVLGAVLCAAGLFTAAQPNEFRAVVRMKVHRQPPLSGRSGLFFSDPYFIQTEFEVIQSEAVLGRVVEKLDLVSDWRNKPKASNKLNRLETIGMLRRQMGLRLIQQTELIEVRVISDSPAEAAKLANTIAEAFQEFRQEQNQVLKSESETANSGVSSHEVLIVDSATAPVMPIRPNRPLAAAVFVFGLLLMILGIYCSTRGDYEQINANKPQPATPSR